MASMEEPVLKPWLYVASVHEAFRVRRVSSHPKQSLAANAQAHRRRRRCLFPRADRLTTGRPDIVCLGK
jgi:hypothetical protein